MKYNKAVRDNIPDIIKKSGRICNVKSLSDTEFLSKMEEKLLEEFDEYNKSKSVEELADLLEVIYRIAELRRVSRKKLEDIRLKKLTERGGFNKNLFLTDSE